MRRRVAGQEPGGVIRTGAGIGAGARGSCRLASAVGVPRLAVVSRRRTRKQRVGGLRRQCANNASQAAALWSPTRRTDHATRTDGDGSGARSRAGAPNLSSSEQTTAHLLPASGRKLFDAAAQLALLSHVVCHLCVKGVRPHSVGTSHQPCPVSGATRIRRCQRERGGVPGTQRG